MLENLEIIVTGFLVVMLALAILWAACSLVGSFFIRQEKNNSGTGGKDHAPKVPPRAAVASRAGVPPHHLAAIAAAVAATLGAGYKVTRVAAPPHKVSEWPLEGRISSFSGHNTRNGWASMMPLNSSQTPNSLRGQK
nr:OadG family transporter subunit [uncultured Cohaesibacter sp.]